MKINQFRPQDSKFTEVLESIALKPEMLYCRGFLPAGRPKTVAIVGSRKNTTYGEEIAYKLAYELAKRQVVIVSGLAYGIDSIAHRGAVDAGGITIGVLGNEIETIRPVAHEGLAEKMIKLGGAVISEYSRDGLMPKSMKVSFLMRNRIIAGLADVVVVVEAAEKSGSLNTAMHALEQGKDLLAVPGNINQVMSAGCNRLIQQGAMPYLGVDDVLNLLFPVKKKRKLEQMSIFGDSEMETEILRLIASGMNDGDEIINKISIQSHEFSQTITMLEIKGRVKALGMNKWIIV